MKKILILSLLLSATDFSSAQEFTMKWVELAGDKLLIYYDLIDSVKDRRYTINLYSSLDNYINPLQKLSGDRGLEVKPGTNKKIIWNAKEELGAAFDGKVGLEIRGRLYIPFVRFTGFEDYKVRKRGVPFAITWSGGRPQNVLNFDLYNKEGTLVWTEPGVGNTGNTEITIPTSVKPGSGYSFRISDAKNRDEVVNTGGFEIKRKIPLLLKAVAVAGIGGIIYLLSTKDGGSSGPEEIVPAPCPDGTNNCN